MDKNARIYVAGHRGLVGSALMRNLEARGYTNFVTRTHAQLDLTSQAEVEAAARAAALFVRIARGVDRGARLR